MNYCEDCGCRVGAEGICSNCQEELYIETYQGGHFTREEDIENFARQAREHSMGKNEIKTSPQEN